MIEKIVAWLLISLEVLVISYLIPQVQTDGFLAALAVALVLGILNATLKPILKILALPINLLSFGLFNLVINTGMIYLTAWLVPGFQVQGFMWALIFSVALSVTNSIVGIIFGD